MDGGAAQCVWGPRDLDGRPLPPHTLTSARGPAGPRRSSTRITKPRRPAWPSVRSEGTPRSVRQEHLVVTWVLRSALGGSRPQGLTVLMRPGGAQPASGSRRDACPRRPGHGRARSPESCPPITGSPGSTFLVYSKINLHSSRWFKFKKEMQRYINILSHGLEKTEF